jgi:hypothetical protein
VIALPVTDIDDSLPVMFVVDGDAKKKNRKTADEAVNFVFSSSSKWDLEEKKERSRRERMKLFVLDRQLLFVYFSCEVFFFLLLFVVCFPFCGRVSFALQLRETNGRLGCQTRPSCRTTEIEQKY